MIYLGSLAATETSIGEAARKPVDGHEVYLTSPLSRSCPGLRQYATFNATGANIWLARHKPALPFSHKPTCRSRRTNRVRRA